MHAGILVKGYRTLVDETRYVIKRQRDFHSITPRIATLFLTYRCDSKCKTCTMWQHSREEEINREVDFDTWKIIIDKLAQAGIETAEIFGGNVLLRKELLCAVLQYLHEKGITIHLPINQIGFDSQVAEAVVKNVDKVYLSFDGVGTGIDIIRGIDHAEKLAEDALEELQRIRKSISRNDAVPLKIVCNCTVSKFNAASLDKIAEFAVKRKFDELHFEYAGEFERSDVEASKVMGVIPDAKYIRQDDSILVNKEEALEIKKTLISVKKKYKDSSLVVQTINLDSLSVKNISEGTIPHHKCYVERTEVTIDPYGNIVICPFVKNYILGNLIDKSFAEIWNNEKHMAFREAQNHDRMPMCRHCILGVQRNPGVLKSLQRIYLKRIRPKLPYVR